jgi:hypothetical protein
VGALSLADAEKPSAAILASATCFRLRAKWTWQTNCRVFHEIILVIVASFTLRALPISRNSSGLSKTRKPRSCAAKNSRKVRNDRALTTLKKTEQLNYQYVVVSKLLVNGNYGAL